MFFAYINLGIIYLDTRNFNDALKYFLYAKKLAISLADPNRKALAYENLGSLYSRMNNYNAAIINEDSSLYFARIENKPPDY